MWTRKEFEDAAQKIGENFVSQSGAESIDDLSTKVALDNGLSPEGIRTMVRLANVAAFEQTFEKRSQSKSEDRMIEFKVGDPEVVISNLHNEVKESQAQEKVAAEYNQTNDYFGDINYDRAPLEKTASAVPGVELTPPPERQHSKQEINLLFKKAEDKMREDQSMAEHVWMQSLTKAASLLVASDSRVSARSAFEKNAVSALGSEAIPELRMMHKLTSPLGSEIKLFGGEKTAEVLRTHIATGLTLQQPILTLLKEAQEARGISHVKAEGLKWLEVNRVRVSK